MIEIDTDCFCQEHRHRGEQIISSIECINQGNPFPGTLILTDQRLFFLRKASPGAEAIGLRLNSIEKVDHRTTNGSNFVITVSNPSFAHQYLIRGIDQALKKDFVERIKKQISNAKLASPTMEPSRPLAHHGL